MKIEFTKKEKWVFYILLCLALLVTIIIHGISFVTTNFKEGTIGYFIGIGWVVFAIFGIIHIGFKSPK